MELHSLSLSLSLSLSDHHLGPGRLQGQPSLVEEGKILPQRGNRPPVTICSTILAGNGEFSTKSN